MTETLYPWGYKRTMVTMERLKQLARWDLIEPEFGARIEAWLISRGGKIGVGGAFRTTQPDLPGFAPDGRSFHQLQQFADGTKYYMALDLVHVNGDNIHRSPTWAEVPKQGSGHADISNFRVHCNVAGEPWHIQVIEADGWGGWVNNGRLRPVPNFSLVSPVEPTPPAPEPPSPTPTPDPNAGGPFSPGARILRVTDPQMEGMDVAFVQLTIREKANDTVVVDGFYGPATAEAVKAVQAWFHVTSDGVVGAETWPIIIEMAKPVPEPVSNQVGSRVLKLAAPTMQGQDVLWVQNQLRKTGLVISADGVYGKQTVAKVKIFQGWNKLEQDGVVGPQTLEFLKRV